MKNIYKLVNCFISHEKEVKDSNFLKKIKLKKISFIIFITMSNFVSASDLNQKNDKIFLDQMEKFNLVSKKIENDINDVDIKKELEKRIISLQKEIDREKGISKIKNSRNKSSSVSNESLDQKMKSSSRYSNENSLLNEFNEESVVDKKSENDEIVELREISLKDFEKIKEVELRKVEKSREKQPYVDSKDRNKKNNIGEKMIAVDAKTNIDNVNLPPLPGGIVEDKSLIQEAQKRNAKSIKDLLMNHKK